MKKILKYITYVSAMLACVVLCLLFIPARAFGATLYTVDYMNGEDVVYTQSSSVPGFAVSAPHLSSTDGSTFLGWVSNPNDIQSVYHSGNSFDIRNLSTYDVEARHACVYSLWQKIELESFYARFDDPNLYKDEACTQRIEVKIPSYPGYEFAGWFAEPECETLIITAAGQFAGNDIDGYVSSMGWAMTENVTLYAGWIELDGSTLIGDFDSESQIMEQACAYSISFIIDGGDPITYSASSTDSFYKIAAPSADELGILREGYVFVGWNTEIDATGQMYSPGDDIIISGNSGSISNLCLYPIWEIQSPLFSFTIDGKVYQFEPEMSWSAWIESKYNTDGYALITCEQDENKHIDYIAVLPENDESSIRIIMNTGQTEPIIPDSIIESGADYTTGLTVFKVLEAPWLGGDPPPDDGPSAP